VTFEKSKTVFLNGFLHYMGNAMGGHHIFAVDMEGKTWRKNPNRARGDRRYIHQAQGNLCQCIVSGRNMSKLSISILENYGTNKWTLNHTISIRKVFAKTKVQFGYLDLQSSYSAVIVYPELNLILFVRAEEESAVIACHYHI
jgi:hypothetical protein